MQIAVAAPAVDMFKNIATGKVETNWAMMCFGEGKDGDTLDICCSGSDGFAGMKAKFDPTKVQFGILRVIACDRIASVESKREKIVFVTWVGSKVSGLKKARVSLQKNGVTSKIINTTCGVDVMGDPADFKELDVAKKLLACGGAHRPTHYIFGPDDEIEVAVVEGRKGASEQKKPEPKKDAKKPAPAPKDFSKPAGAKKEEPKKEDKPKPKPERKPSPKPEPVPEPKPEEPKPEPVPEPKPEEPKPEEPKPEPVPEPTPEEPKPEEPKPEPVPEPTPDAPPATDTAPPTDAPPADDAKPQ